MLRKNKRLLAAGWLLCVLLTQGFAAPVRSAAEPDYPPLSVVGSDETADGFSVELLRATLAEMGVEVSFQTGAWSAIKTGLAEGRLDVLPLVGRTPEREALFDFTTPYLTLHGAIFVRSDNAKIRSPADLQGLRIAVMKGDNAEEYVRRARLSEAVIATPTFTEAFQMLSDGRADAVIAQRLMGISLLKQMNRADIQIAGAPIKEFEQAFCFAVKKGDTKLLAALNEGLAIVTAKGIYRRLERKWIRPDEEASTLSRTLIYSDNAEYPPYSFLDEQGQPTGFHVELIRAIARKTGLNISIELAPGKSILEKMKNGAVDITSIQYPNPEREAWADFSIPHSSVQRAVFARRDSPPYKTPEDLKGRRISVVAEGSLHKYALRNELSPIMEAKSIEESMALLANGQADFTLCLLAPGRYWISKNGWDHLSIVDSRLYENESCYAVRKGNTALLGLLNNGLTQLKESGEYQQIYSRWLGVLERKGLSLEEEEALRKRVLVFSDNFASPPHSFLDERGRPAGFNVDLLRAIARQTGLNISFQLAPWGEVPDKLQSGAVDITCMQYPNPEKEAWVDFSVPHSIAYQAVFARRNSPPYKTLQDLKGRRISATKRGALYTYALQQGFGKTLTETESLEGALSLLKKSEVDFALGRLSSGLYWIRHNGWKDLYAVDASIQKYEFCYVVRKGDAALLNLLNEGMTRLKESGEYQQIYNQWLGVLEPESYYWLRVRKMILTAGVTIALLTTAATLLIVALRRMVNKRTAELDVSNQSLRESRQAALNLMEDAVLAKERLELTQFAIDHSNDPAFWINSAGRFVYVNEVACRTLGYDKEELLRLSLPDIDPNVLEERWPLCWREYQETKTFQFETHHKTKGGRVFPVEVYASYIKYGDKEYLCTSAHDITYRKESEQRLRFEQNLFLSFMESLPANVYFKDTNSRIVYVNQRTATYRGMAKEALIGKTDFDFFPEDQARKKFADEQRVMQTGQPIQIEELSGTVWHQTTKAPRYDENGNLAGTLGISWDITQRKQADQSLASTASLLQATFESTADGLLVVDLNNKIVQFNQKFTEMWRMPADILTAHDDHRAIAFVLDQLKDPGAFTAKVKDLYEHPEDVSFDILEFKDGRSFERYSQPQKIDGKVAGRVWSFRDVTNRIIAQQKLEESRRFLRTVIDSIPVRVFWKDRDSTYLGCNLPFARDVGIASPEEVVGETDFDLVTTNEQSEAFRADDRAVIESGMPRLDFEEPQTRPDGTLHWLKTSKIPLKNIQGEIVGVIGAYEDITEEKNDKAELLRLYAAIEQSPEIILITNRDGDIQYVNPAFTTITGYSREEALGKNPRILKSGDHDKPFYSNLWKTITSGKTWKGHLVNKRKGGEIYTEEAVISSVRDPYGTITSYVAVKRDITQELAQEEKFRQSQKMDAIGRLTGGIAHDFNNVLQAILGFSELLINQLEKDTLEHQNALEVQKAARRAAEMTRQLLTFSRNQPADMKRIDLNTVFRDIEAILQLTLGIKTALTFVMHPALHEIYIDPGQITQLLINLTVNARDAMPDGGHLTIATENITFAPQALSEMPEARPGSFVCLSATDTGCGMSREVKDHLFEPFFTTKAVGKGTGMGLSVVYGIVKQNKGWIHVDSEEGRGTTLKIYLPAYEAPATDNPTDRTRNDRILLVEDDAGMRNMFIQILESAGYKPVVAASAEEALELFKEQKGDFDLLFSDIVIPGKDGIELADLLRKESPGLPVVLCSGYQNQHDRWLLLESKGYHFLKKPVSVDGLLTAVYSALTEVV